MSDEPSKKRPDGVIPLDVGCFKQKTEQEMKKQLLDFFDPKNLEAVYKGTIEKLSPPPPAQRGKGEPR
jgi:hypothetical protein